MGHHISLDVVGIKRGPAPCEMFSLRQFFLFEFHEDHKAVTKLG